MKNAIRDISEVQRSLEVLGLETVDESLIEQEFIASLLMVSKSWQSSIASSTLVSRQCDLRRFVKWCAQSSVNPFSSKEEMCLLIEQHVRYVAEVLSPGTVGRVSSNLTAFAVALNCDDAVRGSRERRRLIVRAAQRAPSPTGKTFLKPRLSLEQMRQIRAIAFENSKGNIRGKRDLAIFDLMSDLMMRRSEAAGLKWKDVDVVSGRVTIVYSKTDQQGKGVTFSLSPNAAETLREWFDTFRASFSDGEALSSCPVFPGIRNSGKISLDGSGHPVFMDGKSVARVIQRYAATLDIEGVSGHSLRRSMAKVLYEAGVPEEQIVQKGRWSSLEQMREYVGISTPIQGAMDLVFS